jgi:hypothetical protein
MFFYNKGIVFHCQDAVFVETGVLFSFFQGTGGFEKGKTRKAKAFLVLVAGVYSTDSTL